MKITEGGVDRVVEQEPRSTAVNLACVISEIGVRFYWASRDNKELRRYESGAFTTFVAVDGSGYVRVIHSDMKAAAALVYGSAKEFDYVEHMLLGLDSVTYYGRLR